MKIRKFLHSGVATPLNWEFTGFDWLNRDTPISYEDIAYEPIPDNAPKSKKVSWSDRISRALNNAVNAPVLPATTGSTNLLGTNTYGSTIDNELKIAGVGAATVATPAAATALAPGSSFWMNPLVQQTVASTVGGEAVNLASQVATGRTVGLNVGDALGLTGWNPNNSAVGSFATELFNPGYFLTPAKLTSGINIMGNALPYIGRVIDHSIYKAFDYPTRKLNNLYKYITADERLYELNRSMNKEYVNTANLLSKLKKYQHNKELENIDTEIIMYGKRFDGNVFPNYSKMSPENIERFFEKHQPDNNRLVTVGDGYAEFVPKGVNDSGNVYGNTGPFSILDFETGTFNTGHIQLPSREGIIRRVYFSGDTPSRWDLVFKDSNNLQTVKETSPTLQATVRNNIEYVKKHIPGFVPFGSAQGVAEGGLNHITHDIDGYMTKKAFDDFAKTHSLITRREGETYRYSLGKQFGDAGDIDINVVSIDAKGYGNARAAQLYRQFFPDLYKKYNSHLTNISDKRVKILDANGNPMTEEYLLDSVDPTVATILDSFEIPFYDNSAKLKHAGRALNYLIGDNPKAVSQALKKASEMQFGRDINLPKLNYGSKDDKIALLKDIGYPEELIPSIVEDSQKFDNAMKYWFVWDNSFHRGTNAGDFRGGNESWANLMRNATTWNPSAGGGNLSGAGLNTVRGAYSGVQRNHNAFIFPKIEGLMDGMDAREAISLIKWTNESTGEIPRYLLDELLKLTHHTYPDGTNLNQIISRIPSDNKPLFSKVVNLLKTNGLSNPNSYTYRGTEYMGLRDLFPEEVNLMPGDNIEGFFTGIPSLTARRYVISNMSNNYATNIFNDLISLKKPAQEFWVPNVDKELIARGIFSRKHIDDDLIFRNTWINKRRNALNKSLENLHKSGRRLQNIGRNSLSPNVQYKDLFETYLPIVNTISGVGIFGLGALGGINAYIRPKLARDLLTYYKDVPEEKLEDWEKEEIKRAKEILGITDNKVLNDPLLFDKPLVRGSRRRRIKRN